jgi:ribosomal protein S12 methylthiotransferase
MTKPTYALVSLGCPKNLVDSERMAGRLKLAGYQLVPQPDGADFAVVNTCGFLQCAREESLETIREMIGLKRAGRLGGVIVAGCLAQRDKEALWAECPGIDQVVGVFGRDEIAQAADRLLGGLVEQRTIFRPAPTRALSDADRFRLTPRHLAYLKISEGCDRLCTFCIIPKIRGKHVSKPIEQVLEEAEQLAAEGTRELVVVAQDTTYYGLDLYGEPRLAALLDKLDSVSGVQWIRLMYLYPQHVTAELVDLLAARRKVLPYIDLPLQHINDQVLRRMNRRGSRAEIERLLGDLRARIPGLAVRTTLITGFPGETEEQFEELAQFVVRQRFERLGVFAYSREPGTPADRLDDHLPPEVGQARRNRLLALQQEISRDWNRAQLGRRMEVIIDSEFPGQDEGGTASSASGPRARGRTSRLRPYLGRTYADAPEIDGAVYVTGKGLVPGQIVACEIVEARDYDLIGVTVH